MSAAADWEAQESYIGTTQLRAIWRRFLRKRLGVAGLILLALIGISVVLVPAVSPFQTAIATSSIDLWMVPVNVNPDFWFAPAASTDPATGLTYWLGTDKLGRDVLTRIFLGGRVTLPMALIAALLTTLVGTIIGLVAGYYGGWLDSAFMRFTDFVLAWPLIPVYLIAFKFLRGPIPPREFITNTLLILTLVVLTFVLFSWMGLARLVRATVLSLRAQAFIEATRALGAGDRRIIFKHLLPNSLAPILVAATLMVGDFIIFEAILSYFGQGVSEPPAPTWGNLLVDGQGQIWYVTKPNPFEQIRFYLFLFPALMILITVLAINFTADALRSALTPVQR